MISNDSLLLSIRRRDRAQVVDSTRRVSARFAGRDSEQLANETTIT
ncbi:hypothetical protein [Natrinema gelatinilyticum]|nr:hypothetical protein [Natrinema gelatinilyticum]